MSWDEELLLIDTLYNHQYYCKLNDICHLSWHEGLNEYKNHALDKCIAPNKEFAEDESLLYVGSNKECNLKKWFKEPDKEGASELLKLLVKGSDRYKKEIRFTDFKDNLSKLAEFSAGGLEKLLTTSKYMHGYIIDALSNNLDHQLSPETIKVVAEHLNNEFNKSQCGKKKCNSDIELLTNYIAKYSKDSSDLTRLLNIAYDGKFDNEAREYVITNLTYQELGTQAVSDLENYLNNQFNKDSCKVNLCKIETSALIHYITHYAKELEYSKRIISIVATDNFDEAARGLVISAFGKEIAKVEKLPNSRIYEEFIKLVPYENTENILVKVYADSYKKHGYIVDLESIKYFERFLDSGAHRKDSIETISNSIIKELSDTTESSNLNIIEGYVDKIFDRAGIKGEELPNKLVESVFSYYQKSQVHFTNQIVNLIAENKYLDKSVLSKLLEPLVKVNDKQASLFMGLRLAEHHIKFESELIEYFISFLDHKEEAIKSIVIKIFDEIAITISEDLQVRLANKLISLLGKIQEITFDKIIYILNNLKLKEEDIEKVDIQKKLILWNKLSNEEDRKTFIKDILVLVNTNTTKEFKVFLRKLIESQNIQILGESKLLYKEIEKYEVITFDNEAVKDLIRAVDEESVRKNFKEVGFGKDNRFFISKEQFTRLEEKFKGFEYNIGYYIKKIIFNEYKEVDEFLDFLEFNGIEKEDLSLILEEEKGIKDVYKTFIIAKLGDILDKLDNVESKILNRSIWYLIKEVKWTEKEIYKILSQNVESGILVATIEKIAEYKVSEDLVDRKGESVVNILEGNDSKWLAGINKLINDNNFYIEKDVETLLLEISKTNEDNESINRLLKSNYFRDKLTEIRIIGKNWQSIKYEILVSQNRPEHILENHLYLYKEGGNLFIETISGKGCLKDIEEKSVLRLEELIQGGSEIQESDREIIYEESHKLKLTPAILGITKSLDKWGKSEYLKWKNSLGGINDLNISEVIAVISNASSKAILKSESSPRGIQIIALLSLLKSEKGGLAQISTGEGKTLIIALFNVIKMIESGDIKRQIDVITSSRELAVRDARKLAEFYDLFGITVAHNIKEEDESLAYRRNCYKADIVYGDLTNFIGDTLRDISIDTKKGRGFDIVVLDEVDNMLIDQSNMKIQLTSTIHGMELLGQVMLYLWGHGTEVGMYLETKSSGCYLKMGGLNEEDNKNFNKIFGEDVDLTKIIEPIYVGDSCESVIRDEIKNFTTSTIFGAGLKDLKEVKIPNHLEDYSKNQLDNWLSSWFTSYKYEELKEYITIDPPGNKTGKNNFKVVAPIDYAKTGVIQFNLQLSDGLHQFLQLKHDLTLTSENIVTTFMSYYGYISKYKGDIYGVTGTLGGKEDKAFLKSEYNVELTTIPTFIKKDLTIFETVIVKKEEEWVEEIINTLHRKIDNQRAALVIVETIDKVNILEKALRTSGYDNDNIYTYGTGNKGEKKIVEEKELNKGDIIIATNLAGRGTDLQLSPEVVKNRGLHVILATFPKHIRVEEQGYGRGARQGEPGSAQMILTLEHLDGTSCSEDIGCLTKERAEYELMTLKSNSLCQLPTIKLKDEVFNLFIETLKDFNSPTGYQIILGNPNEMRPFSLYLYKEGGNLILKAIKESEGEKIVTDLDISKLGIIDSGAAYHIRTITGISKGTASSLNRQDYETINYLAATEGFTTLPIIIDRINYEYTKAQNTQHLKCKGTQDVRLTEEEKYLKCVYEGENSLYKDLDEKSDNFYENIKLRKKFQLWLRDRRIYNTDNEVAQVTEYFGIWLKGQYKLLDIDCDLNKENEIKAAIEKADKELINGYIEFSKKLNELKNNNKVFSNPAHLVLKGWDLLYLETSEKQSREALQNRREELRKAYEEYKEYQKLQSSWYGRVYTGIQDYASGLLKTIKASISFGEEIYMPQNPIESSIESFKNSTSIDQIYSWTGYNGLAYSKLVKNGTGIWKLKQADKANDIKKEYVEDTNRVIDKIADHIIPVHEAQLSYLLIKQIVDWEDDIVMQMIGTIKVYEEIIGALQKNIKYVYETEGNEMIRMGRYIPMEEITANVMHNITEALVGNITEKGTIKRSGSVLTEDISQNLNFTSHEYTINQITASGGYIFALERYELEDTRSWWGTIGAVVLGVLSIAAGIGIVSSYGLVTTTLSSSVFAAAGITSTTAVVSGSIFGSVLGASLVLQGVGDIIGSIVSIATNNPIDFGDYLNSKGMSLGISIATAGTLHFLGSIPSIDKTFDIVKNIGKITQSANLVGASAAIQATSVALSSLIYNSAKDIVDEDEIEEKAKEAVEKLIQSHYEQLQKIFATDKLHDDIHGSKELNKILNQEIESIIKSYQGRFHGDKSRFATGYAGDVGGQLAGSVAPGGNFLGWGNIIQTVIKGVQGVVKNSEAIDKILGKVGSKINDIAKMAQKTPDIMVKKLESAIKDFNEENSKALLLSMSVGGYINSAGEIPYNECERFGSINLTAENTKYKQEIIDSCTVVSKLMNSEYFKSYEEFKNKLISNIASTKAQIQKHELVKPLTDSFGGVIGGEIGKRIVEHVQEAIETGKAKQNQELNFEDNNLNPKFNKQNPSKLTNINKNQANDLEEPSLNNADNSNKQIGELSNEAKYLHKKYSMYSDKVGAKDKSLWNIWKKSSKAVTWEQFLTANNHLADPNIIKPGDNIYMLPKYIEHNNMCVGNLDYSKYSNIFELKNALNYEEQGIKNNNEEKKSVCSKELWIKLNVEIGESVSRIYGEEGTQQRLEEFLYMNPEVEERGVIRDKNGNINYIKIEAGETILVPKKIHPQYNIEISKQRDLGWILVEEDNVCYDTLADTNPLSYDEFSKTVRSDLSANINNVAGIDYINEKYQEYLNNGNIEISTVGLWMHEGGYIIDKFKKDNPNLSGEIKLFVDNTGKISGVIVYTTAYILRPLKPVWEIYRDAVNEYLVPDVVKEWMNEKASKTEKGLQQWEKGLTSKQKVMLDTSIDGVKFGGDIVIVGSTTKLAGKLVLEGGAKKLVTKSDNHHHKTHTDIIKAGTEAGGGYKHSIEVDIKILEKKINFPDDLNNPKLRSKFDTHKKDFGMQDANFNKESVQLYKQKILDHIKDDSTIPIAGKYKRGSVGDVVHYYNPKTQINVMKDTNNNWVSGWKLSDVQIKHLKLDGMIGGSR